MEPIQEEAAAGSPSPPQPKPPPAPRGRVNLLTNFLAACARNIAASATGALGPVSSPSSSPAGGEPRLPPSSQLPPSADGRTTTHPSSAVDPRDTKPLGAESNAGSAPDSERRAQDDVSQPRATDQAAADARRKTDDNNSSGRGKPQKATVATVSSKDGGGAIGGRSNNNSSCTPARDDPDLVRKNF